MSGFGGEALVPPSVHEIAVHEEIERRVRTRIPNSGERSKGGSCRGAPLERPLLGCLDGWAVGNRIAVGKSDFQHSGSGGDGGLGELQREFERRVSEDEERRNRPSAGQGGVKGLQTHRFPPTTGRSSEK